MIRPSPAFLKQLWLTMGASLAFLIIGLVRGYSASALPSIATMDPHLIKNSEQKSWIGSSPPLGAFAGSILSGTLMQRAGRKRTLQLTAPLWATGWLLLGFGHTLSLVLIARFVCGFCVGLVLAPTQIYVSECCDPEIRGRLGSLPTLSMSLGILISYVAGNWLNWRHLAFLSAAFCGGLFVALLPMPESPMWLRARGLDDGPAIAWLHLSARATQTEDATDPNKMATRSLREEEIEQYLLDYEPSEDIFEDDDDSIADPDFVPDLKLSFEEEADESVEGVDIDGIIEDLECNVSTFQLPATVQSSLQPGPSARRQSKPKPNIRWKEKNLELNEQQLNFKGSEILSSEFLELDTPIQFFLKIFAIELIEHFANETNLYIV